MNYTIEQIAELHAELSELKSIRRDFLEFVKKVSRATVTVPWEAGYGPEYMPTAGDPERSVADLIAAVRQKTAVECADIAYWYDRGSKAERGIRTHFGIDGNRFGKEDPCLLDWLALGANK